MGRGPDPKASGDPSAVPNGSAGAWAACGPGTRRHRWEWEEEEEDGRRGVRTSRNHALLSSRPRPRLRQLRLGCKEKAPAQPAATGREGGGKPLVRGPGKGSRGSGAQPSPPFGEAWHEGATPQAQRQILWCHSLPPNEAGERGLRGQGRQGPQKHQEAATLFTEKLWHAKMGVFSPFQRVGK